jgi:hypothetical protein
MARFLSLDRDEIVASQAGASAANLRLALSDESDNITYVGAAIRRIKAPADLTLA